MKSCACAIRVSNVADAGALGAAGSVVGVVVGMGI
jgi:hypothetical protein